MSAVSILNSRADVLKKSAALAVNSSAAKGLEDVLKSNLGPRGTLKMLVGGAGQIKLTKDGNVLLHEMQIQHPTASMIGRATTAQDDITGDGTTSNVIIIGELMKYSERYIVDGVHPHVLCEGFQISSLEILYFLDEYKTKIDINNRNLLIQVAQTSLNTKILPEISIKLSNIVVDSILTIYKKDIPIDLFMIEILHMKHRYTVDTKLIKGLVLDHGCRHPDMPTQLNNCYILTCNVSLEYEKSEINSGFMYGSATQRDRLVTAERAFTDEKVLKIIKLKNDLCNSENKMNLVVLNQKGIDPPSLDMLARNGIMALRRVKRRNMERLTLACGGSAVNSVDDVTKDDLGYADSVREEVLGEDKFTFVEGVKDPRSCTILIRGSSDHSIAQLKDAVRDGLRSVKNAIEDECLVAGGGAFEVAAAQRLQQMRLRGTATYDTTKKVTGKVKLGVCVFEEALLGIPRTLALNSGFDQHETVLKLQEAYESCLREGGGKKVGLDLLTGEPCYPEDEGIWDNYRVKRQLLSLAPTLAQQLLRVDEVIKAGKQMGKE
eukprot:GHVR01123181.1.p1 GENE.GHVR01123181.1~~GHVR01123181.1.p1  ORF type:complete len:549 (-),score=139.98 GHVR01123181.1:34-1680(-)